MKLRLDLPSWAAGWSRSGAATRARRSSTCSARARRASSAVIAATWTAHRTPRQFIARHRGGARFSALPDDVKSEAMARLAAWAEPTFGSLDAAFSEAHSFELQVFKFRRSDRLMPEHDRKRDADRARQAPGERIAQRRGAAARDRGDARTSRSCPGPMW